MAVVSIKNKLRRGNLLVGNDPFIPTSFDSIATAIGTGSSGTITFSSIPSTYQHLQVRILFRDTVGATTFLRFNGDSTSGNYVAHTLTGNGSGTGSVAYTASQTGIRISPNPYLSSVIYAAAIIDIHDYVSTTKNKTVRLFTGYETNGTDGQLVLLGSGLWLSTSAVTSLTIYTSGGNFPTDAQFALYGIKGA